ncbi:multicopper oxidase-domain-containing protein [Spinellus fusiger]|nr:multicopper oxidase-domain-containing protein [Spinellus fusiger]
MRLVFPICGFLFTLYLCTALQQESIKYYEFNLSSIAHNADCSNFTGNVLAINGQIPAPPIVATKGDRIKIMFRNNLQSHDKNSSSHDMANHASIHFHGIRQYGSTEADGVPFLTQNPIPPGGFYVYDFKVTNQAGTFFYHSHVGMQEITVYGAIIIYESPEADPSHQKHKPLEAYESNYHDERTVVLSEWWHKDLVTFENYLLGPKFAGIWEAESILINGQTIFPSKDITRDCQGYTSFSVEPNKTYRFRIIGATAFRTLGFTIGHHTMTIIEVDGEPVEPYDTSFLEVASGQRFSVLVHTNQKPSDYTISTIRRWTDATTSTISNGLAILHYTTPQHRSTSSKRKAISTPHTILEPLDFPKDSLGWEWNNIKPLYGSYAESRRPADRTVLLRSTDEKQKDGSTRWYINGVTFQDPTKNYLAQVLNSSQSSQSSQSLQSTPGIYSIKFHETVDFVLQTTRSGSAPCRSHPWHTHGHSHWEIARGSGDYIDSIDSKQVSKHALFKDVTLVYPSTDQVYSKSYPQPKDGSIGCGWTKVRIFADNPGIWALHCHNAAHVYGNDGCSRRSPRVDSQCLCHCLQPITLCRFIHYFFLFLFRFGL